MSINRNIEDDSSERESFAPSLIDRARDAVRPKPPLVIPHDNPYGFAAEVVRLHDEFAALADAMDQEAHYLRFDCMDEEADYRQEAAARIREVIERDK